MIHDLSGSWCIKGTGESMDSPVPLMVMDSPVPLMVMDSPVPLTGQRNR